MLPNPDSFIVRRDRKSNLGENVNAYSYEIMSYMK